MRDDVVFCTVASLPKLAPIPSGVCGDYSIKQQTVPKGYALPYLGATVILKKPYQSVALKHFDATWMSQTPQEIAMMDEAAQVVRGRVLVGGLGLGVFLRLAGAAQHITVVERCPEVIELVGPTIRRELGNRVTIEQADIAEYLECCGREFDFVYLDTWDSPDPEYLPWMNWLIRRSEAVLRPGGEVMAWAYCWTVRRLVLDSQGTVKVLRSKREIPAERIAGMLRAWPITGRIVEWAYRNGWPTLRKVAAEARRVAAEVEARPVAVMEKVTAKKRAHEWVAEVVGQPV